MYKNIVLLLDLFLEHFDSCCLVAGVGVSSLEVAPHFMSHSLIFLGILSVCHSSCSLGMRDTICFSRCLVDTIISILGF
jgi:hypothetical protein